MSLDKARSCNENIAHDAIQWLTLCSTLPVF